MPERWSVITRRVTFTNTMVSGNASVTGGTGNVAGMTFSGNTMTVTLPASPTCRGSHLTEQRDRQLRAGPAGYDCGREHADRRYQREQIGECFRRRADQAQSGVPVTAANFREDVIPERFDHRFGYWSGEGKRWTHLP